MISISCWICARKEEWLGRKMGTGLSAFLAIINLAKSPQMLENMMGCLLQVLRLFRLGVVVSLAVFCVQQELIEPLLDFFKLHTLCTLLQGKVGLLLDLFRESEDRTSALNHVPVSNCWAACAKSSHLPQSGTFPWAGDLYKLPTGKCQGGGELTRQGFRCAARHFHLNQHASHFFWN